MRALARLDGDDRQAERAFPGRGFRGFGRAADSLHYRSKQFHDRDEHGQSDEDEVQQFGDEVANVDGADLPIELDRFGLVFLCA